MANLYCVLQIGAAWAEEKPSILVIEAMGPEQRHQLRGRLIRQRSPQL